MFHRVKENRKPLRKILKRDSLSSAFIPFYFIFIPIYVELTYARRGDLNSVIFFTFGCFGVS